ncbi:MAG: hypothetical protein ACI4UE_04925 [Candidatus Scatovivens sp.]
MIKLNYNKGITLIVLVITIIVILIITGITITLSIDSIDQTVESQDLSEMLIVQHAIKEKYEEYIQNKSDENMKLLGSKKDDGEYEISNDKEKSLYDIFGTDAILIVKTSSTPNLKFYDLEKKEIRMPYIINNLQGNLEVSDFSKKLDKNNEEDKKYYIEEETYILYKSTEDKKNEAIEFRNNIKLEIEKSDFEILGITGTGINNSTFKVNYQTGYVEKVGSSTSPLKGYNQDTLGNTSSHEVSITN